MEGGAGRLEVSIKRSAEAERTDTRRPNNGGHNEHRGRISTRREPGIQRPQTDVCTGQRRKQGHRWSREGEVKLPFIPGNVRSARAVEDVKVRESRRGKQILIDGIEGVTNSTEGLTNMELVEEGQSSVWAGTTAIASKGRVRRARGIR